MKKRNKVKVEHKCMQTYALVTKYLPNTIIPNRMSQKIK